MAPGLFASAAALAFALALASTFAAPGVVGSYDHVMDGIYVGSAHTASNMALLLSLNVSAVLNVAWDIDVPYPAQFYAGSVELGQRLVVQYHKVGLVDGDGNAQSSLAAAVYMLDQLLTPRASLSAANAAMFPEPVRRVFLHCDEGTSRSVTVAALYLLYTHADQFDSYADALAFVKTKRHVQDDDTVPNAALTALASALAPSPILNWFPVGGNSPASTGGGASSGSDAGSHTTSKHKSMSGWLVALVVFAVIGGLFGLYCTVGIFVNKSRGHEGTDLLPHASFWAGLFAKRDPYAVRLPAYDFS